MKYATDVTAQVKAAEALRNAVAETGMIVGAAQANDLTKRIDLTGKTGDIGELCAGVNGLLDTMNSVLSTLTQLVATFSMLNDVKEGQQSARASAGANAQKVASSASAPRTALKASAKPAGKGSAPSKSGTDEQDWKQF